MGDMTESGLEPASAASGATPVPNQEPAKRTESDEKAMVVATTTLKTAGGSVSPGGPIPHKPETAVPMPNVFSKTSSDTTETSLLKFIDTLPKPATEKTKEADGTNHDEFALAQFHGHVDRVLEEAGLPPLYSDDNPVLVLRHEVIILKNRIIIPHINKGDPDIPKIIDELKNRAKAKGPEEYHDPHYTLLSNNRDMIEKLEIGTANTLKPEEVSQANKIADEAGGEFLKKLLTENGGSIPDAHVPLHLQALREKKVEEHALSQSRQSSPTVRLPPWSDKKRKELTGPLDLSFRSRIREITPKVPEEETPPLTRKVKKPSGESDAAADATPSAAGTLQPHRRKYDKKDIFDTLLKNERFTDVKECQIEFQDGYEVAVEVGKKPEPEGLFRAIISEGNPVPNHYFLSLTNAQSFLQKRKSDERTIFNALAKSQEIIDVIERQDGYEVVFSPEGDVEFDSKGQPVVFDPKGKPIEDLLEVFSSSGEIVPNHYFLPFKKAQLLLHKEDTSRYARVGDNFDAGSFSAEYTSRVSKNPADTPWKKRKETVLLAQIAAGTVGAVREGCTVKGKRIDPITRQELEELRQKTKLCQKTEEVDASKRGKFTTTIAVNEKDALDVAKEMIATDKAAKVAVLNLAARHKPCGAFEEGAPAQEESLSRRSAYPFLLKDNKHLLETFKQVTGNEEYHIPHDGVVSSPDVPVIRAGQSDGFRFYGQEERFTVHMIACAGYDLRPKETCGDQESLTLTPEQRKEGVKVKMREILRVAAANGDTCVVLGLAVTHKYQVNI